MRDLRDVFAGLRARYRAAEACKSRSVPDAARARLRVIGDPDVCSIPHDSARIGTDLLRVDHAPDRPTTRPSAARSPGRTRSRLMARLRPGVAG